MTAIIIIAAAALLLFVLLASSVTVNFEYGESFKVKIKYLFITILMNPDSPRRIKKREKKKTKKEAKKEKKAEKQRIKQENKEFKEEKKDSKIAAYKRADNSKETGAKKKPTSSENEPAHIHYKKENGKKDKGKKEKKKVDFELIVRLIKRASPHIKRIFKKIRFYDIDIDITVGGDDAAKVAVSYGVHCSIVNSLAVFLDNTVTFKVKRINIKADFDLEKSRYYANGTVKLRLSTLLHSAIWGACGVLSEMLKANRESEKTKLQSGHKGKVKKAA